MSVGMNFMSLQIIRIPNEISLTQIKLMLTPLKQKNLILREILCDGTCFYHIYLFKTKLPGK